MDYSADSETGQLAIEISVASQAAVATALDDLRSLETRLVYFEQALLRFDELAARKLLQDAGKFTKHAEVAAEQLGMSFIAPVGFV